LQADISVSHRMHRKGSHGCLFYWHV